MSVFLLVKHYAKDFTCSNLFNPNKFNELSTIIVFLQMKK